jgi:hypothetical protein
MKTGQMTQVKPVLLIISIFALLIAGLFGLYAAVIDYIPAQASLSSICSSIFAHRDVLMSAIIIINIAVCFGLIFLIRKMAATVPVMPIMLIDLLLMTLAYAAWTNPF